MSQPMPEVSNDLQPMTGILTAMPETIFGQIKPTPTVQCSVDIALTPWSGTNAGQKSTSNSGNVTGAESSLFKIAAHTPFQSDNGPSKWILSQSDVQQSRPTVKLKLKPCDVDLPLPNVKLKFWTCNVALARPMVKLKLFWRLLSLSPLWNPGTPFGPGVWRTLPPEYSEDLPTVQCLLQAML